MRKFLSAVIACSVALTACSGIPNTAEPPATLAADRDTSRVKPTHDDELVDQEPATGEKDPTQTSAPATTIPSPIPSQTVQSERSSKTTESSSEGAIVVDHDSLDLFERIPEEYIQAAAELRMLYIDRSVGDNINQGLDCLEYSSLSGAPIGCRRNEHNEPEFTVNQSVYNWSRPGGYPRDNWKFEFWPTPGCDEWYDKVECFMSSVEPRIGEYDVLSFQLSYLSVNQGSDIANQPGGFFWDNADQADVHDLEAFEAQYPDTEFIYWTTSLARLIGTEEAQVFNQQMREYAIENGKVLFDVADILSHDPSGNPCFDNRDGVAYSDGTKMEDHPDDGVQLPAICQHYTTETNGGHLGSVVAGKMLVARAFWVLMAQVAGWTP